jgi:hypothetical protein
VSLGLVEPLMEGVEYLFLRAVMGGGSDLTASLMSATAWLALVDKSPAAWILRSCKRRRRSCLPLRSEPASAAAAVMSAAPSVIATVDQAGIGTPKSMRLECRRCHWAGRHVPGSRTDSVAADEAQLRSVLLGP